MRSISRGVALLLLLGGCSGPQGVPPPSGDEVARVAPRRGSEVARRSPASCEGGEKDLLSAAVEGDSATVRACLDEEIDVNAVDRNGRTALALAAGAGSIEVIRLLLEAGAALEPESGVSPLAEAIRNQQEQAVLLLLESGASARGRSALLIDAIGMGDVRIVQALIDHGADPDVTRGDTTPLAAAASRCDEAMVTALLASGADPNRATPSGRPLDTARGRGSACSTVIRLLEDAQGPRSDGVLGVDEPGPNEPGGWKPSRVPEMPSSPRRPPLSQ